MLQPIQHLQEEHKANGLFVQLNEKERCSDVYFRKKRDRVKYRERNRLLITLQRLTHFVSLLSCDPFVSIEPSLLSPPADILSTLLTLLLTFTPHISVSSSVSLCVWQKSHYSISLWTHSILTYLTFSPFLEQMIMPFLSSGLYSHFSLNVEISWNTSFLSFLLRVVIYFSVA